MAKRYSAPDDAPLYIIKRDLSGGINTRNRPEVIGDNQCVMLKNVFLETQGQASMRTGIRQVDRTFPNYDVITNEDGTVITNDDGTPITTENIYATNDDGTIIENDNSDKITIE
jgi:hypothetical protein